MDNYILFFDNILQQYVIDDILYLNNERFNNLISEESNNINFNEITTFNIELYVNCKGVLLENISYNIDTLNIKCDYLLFEEYKNCNIKHIHITKKVSSDKSLFYNMYNLNTITYFNECNKNIYINNCSVLSCFKSVSHNIYTVYTIDCNLLNFINPNLFYIAKKDNIINYCLYENTKVSDYNDSFIIFIIYDNDIYYIQNKSSKRKYEYEDDDIKKKYKFI